MRSTVLSSSRFPAVRITGGFLRLVAASLLVVALAPAGLAESTALDRYVAEPDPAYRFKLVESFPNLNSTTHVLAMASQTWLTTAEVNRTEWHHWITILVPRQLATSTALLFIGAGNNGSSPPLAANADLVDISSATGAVVVELGMVPNQPLVFKGERFPRSEDSLIAYAWDKYLDTGEEKWLPQLPMTKAAVRAMDTVTAFLKSEEGGALAVDKFVVAGASKRGWTAWTTAAVDDRVVAVIPMVIDLLNLEKSMTHHWRAYGFWAPAIADYERMGVLGRITTPEFHALASIVGPYQYRERFTMPKFIVNASGDEFFLPDSSQFYFDDLPGEKYLHYIPNIDHSLKHKDVFESVLTYFQSVIANTPRPQFSWQFPEEGGIVLNSVDMPAEVKLWQATNRFARDFRLQRIGPAWKSTPVAADDDRVYKVSVPEPPQGWTAYFLEMTYSSGGAYPFKFTTPVRVVPDTLPYPPPGAER